MAKVIDKRQRLLATLLEYAEESDKSNPHFYKSEMIKRLGVTEDEFAILLSLIGEQYCSPASWGGTDSRYEIHVDKCLALQDQFDRDRVNEKRHKQLVRLSVLVAILGAVLGVALTLWFRRG